MAANEAGAALGPDDLRRVPLFAALGDGELAWLARQCGDRRLAAGEVLFREGEPALCFHVVLEGELRITKLVDGSETEIDVLPVGAYTGDIGLLIELPHVATARAARPTRLLVFGEATFRELIARNPTVGREMLPLMGARVQGAEVLIREREKLAKLGKLAAGLAHELNNPAAAIRRAADQLADAIAAEEARTLRLGALGLSPEQVALLQEARRSAAGPPLDPVARSDREESLAFRLEDLGVDDAWDLAPALAGAGLDVAWLDDLAGRLPAGSLAEAAAWVAGRIAVGSLVAEIGQSAGRISTLVKSVKSYSFMDRGALQEVDVREGLESTLAILRHKLGDVEVTRDYAPDLPRITAVGSELNQVWTNLIDNAIDAMGGRGRLTVRARGGGEGVLVEIVDDGPGVPPEVRARIFQPFFTTKRMGKGTGLGLDIAYRIVVNRHGGTISLDSKPGETRFAVRLPACPTPAAEGRG